MKHRTLVVSLGGAMLLLGCSNMAPTGPLVVQPTLTLRNSGGVDAEAMYFLGRAYQERGRHADAVRAFRAALAVEPRHAEAHNALGASYFALGQTAQAEQQFRAAIDAAPELAHLRNNLARLYTLSGHEPAGAAVVAATPATAAPAASVAPQPMASAAPAVVATNAAPAASVVPVASSRLLSVASNVWELKTTPPVTPAVAAALPPPAVPIVAVPSAVAATVQQPAAPVVAAPYAVAAVAPRPAKGQRVEVSNGNGVPGLARRVAQFIETQGYRAPRTNNLQPFNQRRTELQYRIGARRQARELAALLTVTPRLVAVTSLERAATVRLVLGRDFKEPASVAGAVPGEQLADMVAMLETK